MHAVDARGGYLADNLAGFGRALRRAGLVVDAERMALASEALLLVGLQQRDDVGAALEAVLASCEQDRLVVRELFDAYLRASPSSEALPDGAMRAARSTRTQRVREALAAAAPPARAPRRAGRDDPVYDAAMTTSDLARLRHADFAALTAHEYHLVERLAREIRLPLPQFAARRVRPGARGARMHWPGVLRQAARSGGEVLRLPRMQRRRQPLPLLVLLDVSGSMERYARLLLVFLHAATRQLRRRDVFAFGTELTDLGPAMRLGDSGQMLQAAAQAMPDYAGGTRLGGALASLRRHHARRLVGRRTLVLLVSDGLDTGDARQLGCELDWLGRHCRRLVWLNPLLRFDGYAPLARGAAALSARAHAMLPVHNLDQLEQLATSLAAM